MTELRRLLWRQLAQSVGILALAALAVVSA